MKLREESDTMGEVLVPQEAYYGPQTQRAVENFPISDLKFPLNFLHALALIKKFAAQINGEMLIIDRQIADAIVQAVDEIIAGHFADQFVVDLFQTGSGTSTNMNMNEVLASRANEILTGKKKGKYPVHPNDHVNACQSSNDVIPSALHIAALVSLNNDLLPALACLQEALSHKAVKFSDVKKIGRTHLQDALPITLGQEFSGYARQIELGMERIQKTFTNLSELALGGTAVGTGLNAKDDFAPQVIALLSKHCSINFSEAQNHFEAQSAQDAAVETSGALRSLAVSLIKIANDLRWLSSGPRCGIGEINIPALQPGSSIMPGKINPVIPEAVLQVAAQVIGNDTTIALGCHSGNFELNVMLPVISYNLLQSIDLLASVSHVFSEKCIKGITVNHEKSSSAIEQSLALVTNFIPHIGYDEAARIAAKAYKEGKTIREIILDENILPEELVTELLR